ncbi:MAG: Alpha-acetolactate decarboxylase [Candidatus Methanofastidiosum methylothiophilum]|uniref:Alpha-acetolactate decarboxylase n=1 Tax=Candidatus Methanofastidiosum methylothiophilum TaxID=1705564 RepID=A0A150IKL4_9EURY|nr:MAG: Alpha-acetolactate decarboxylase [Candidatus Methanofastidiosum methylthiophilus]KYC47615.1 MAG: Alpha-acetolactate decarboxylase [Candidatus Methanofastidiosum methylthiophilus]KYC50232.1 MAG: Alpha-acetolactate decarboxylase [Candidatus Methanofastidiosum methylthiophilus]
MEGIYDGNMTFQELSKYGNYGLGTVNALDGEMIQVNGKFYQIKSDGFAYPIENNQKTPFAVVSFFETDKTIEINGPLDYKQYTEYIDESIHTKNIFYLIIIEGKFDYIKTRSVPIQKKPYIPLVKAIEDQSIFEFNNISGTLVGFRIPEYVGDMNVPGYHFHFLTEDNKAGGHVLDLRIQNQKVHIDYTYQFFMMPPDSEEFYKLNSNKVRGQDISIVEKGK